VKTWPALLAALLLPACGARTGLDAPPVTLVEPGPLPQYCQGADATSIYVVTEQNTLFRFDPPSAAFTAVGTIGCAAEEGATPFSMAVDHQGTAYVVFNDGELFEVSTADASCAPTSTPVTTGTFTTTFGMGFASDADGLSETLFLAADSDPEQLGTLDTSTFVVTTVGTFSSDVGESELTGTGSGRLFAFGVVSMLNGAHLAELDTTDASVESDTLVPTPENPKAWAFAFWGGDFYFFTSTDNATTTVGRFHPTDGSFDATYAALPNGAVVGAGVSTCAPR
jgi:hypothetical protein